MYAPAFTGNQTFTNSTVNLIFNGTPQPSVAVKTDVQEEEVLKVIEAEETEYEAHRNNPNIYKIIQHPKGRVLLINNDFESLPKLARKGSQRDVQAMEDLWKGIGCQVYSLKKLTAEGIVEDVREFVKTRAEFTVIVIMSHGKEDDLILGEDKRKAEVAKIFEAFVNSEFLKDKPKLLFFQMCRGSEIAQVRSDAVGVDSDNSEWAVKLLEELLPGGRILGGNSGADVSDLPSQDYVSGNKHILLAFSTMPNHKSFRNIKKGSWFIQSLAKVFADRAHEDDVVKMMESVKEKVKTYKVKSRGSLYGAVESVDGSDTFGDKKLFLFPGFPRARADA